MCVHIEASAEHPTTENGDQTDCGMLLSKRSLSAARVGGKKADAFDEPVVSCQLKGYAREYCVTVCLQCLDQEVAPLKVGQCILVTADHS